MVFFKTIRDIFNSFIGNRKRTHSENNDEEISSVSPAKRFRSSISGNTSSRERIIPIRYEHLPCTNRLNKPFYKNPMSSKFNGTKGNSENYIEISDDDDEIVEVYGPIKKGRHSEPVKRKNTSSIIENEASDDDVQIVTSTETKSPRLSENKKPIDSNFKFSINNSFRLDDRLKYENMLKSIAPSYGIGRARTNSFLSTPKQSPPRQQTKATNLIQSILNFESTKSRPPDINYIDLTKNDSENDNSLHFSRVTPNVTECFSSFASAVSSLSNSIEYDTFKSVDLTSDASSQSQETDSDIEFVGINDSNSSALNTLKQKLDANPICKEKWIRELTEKHKNNILWKANLIKEEQELKDLYAKHNLKQFNKELENRFRRSLIFDTPIDLIEDSDEESFPELTKSQETTVQKTLSIRSSSEVIVQKFNMSITRSDIKTLEGLNWLNDEIINFYMNLIMERSKLNSNRPKVYAMNTFFYPKLISGGHSSLRRWTKKVDIFEYDLMLVPIHLSVHWCMAVIDFNKKEIKYFDSMGRHNKDCVNALLKYLVDERMDKKREKYPTKDWELPVAKNIPQQMNGSDCGVFSCTFAEFESRQAPFKFSQQDMPYIRRKIIYEIVSGKLLLT